MDDYKDYLEATTGFGDGVFGDAEDAEDARQVAAVQRNEKDAVLCLVDARLDMFASSASSGGGGGVKSEKDAGAVPHTAVTPFAQAMRMVGRIYQDKIITSDRDLLGLVLYNTALTSNPCGLPGVYVIHPFNTLDVERVQEAEQLETAGAPGSAAYTTFVKDVGHRNPQLPGVLDEALWMAQHMLLTVRANVVKYRRIFIFTNDEDPTRGEALSRRRCIDKVRTMQEEGVAVEVFLLGGGSRDEDRNDGERRPGTGTVRHASGGTAGDLSDASGANPNTGSATSNPNSNKGPNGSGPDSIFSSASPGGAPGTLDGSRTLPYQSLLSGRGDGRDDASSVATGNTSHPVGSAGRSGVFWDKLITEASKRPAWATPPIGANSAVSATGYTGSVHVQNVLDDGGGDGAEDDYTYVVLDKLHPQRPFMNTTLTIGMRSDGGAVPRMAVSIYTPIMAATGPKAERLEARTNALVKRQARLVRKAPPASASTRGAGATHEEEVGEEDITGAARAAGTGGVATVRKDDVQLRVAVAGGFVPFSREERAKVTEVAAAGAPPGFTILCFKAYDDALVFKHAFGRSSFLHANLRQGGPDSLRCFVQLVRTLRRQGKAAIALHLRTAKSAPRLVALVPSPPPESIVTAVSSLPLAPHLQESHSLHGTAGDGRAACAAQLQFPSESLPAEGLGLYVVPLPFADDIRPLPPPDPATVKRECGGGNEEEEEEGVKREGQQVKPPDDQVRLADRIITALTVPYDITAVANPSVQLQYHMLKKLALQNLAANANGGGERVRREAKSEEDGEKGSAPSDGGRTASTSRDGFRDFTQPDWEGMSKHAALFRDFNSAVLGPGYDADALCPQPKSAASTAARRPRGSSPTARAATDGGEDAAGVEDAVREAAGTNTWHRLTVAQLRAYLKKCHGAGGGARRKDELIAAAQAAYATAAVKKEGE